MSKTARIFALALSLALAAAPLTAVGSYLTVHGIWSLTGGRPRAGPGDRR